MRDMNIQLFADGACVKDMVRLRKKGIVSGFTTNPSLMKKSDVINYKAFSKSVIDEIPDLPISFEVLSDDLNIMKKEAQIISSWGDNIYVKIPITNTLGISTVPIIKSLSDEGIKLNITAILTTNQVDVAVESLSKTTPSIISIFAGRIADTGIDPRYIMRLSSSKVMRFKNIELLWASTREVLNILQAYECRCNIITVTPDILKKLPMLGKDLTELSLETVKQFHDDAASAGYKIL